MLYNDFHGLRISALGMGNMRLPIITDTGKIDYQKAQDLIELAISNGVNYFDTAYRYHGGESELFIGVALKKYPRDSYYLASKLPGHMMNFENGQLGFQGYMSGSTISSISEIFEDQLKRCQVDYFDFYLLHNLCETSYEFYTNEELGVVKYLLEQKAAGRIKYLGLSAHSRAETLENFSDHYDCFDFVQIQLNYLDWILQEGKEKHELLTKRNIPIIVMEPCRGGKLSSFNDQTNALVNENRPNETISSLAFRYLKSLPNILTTLSGMTTKEQLLDNINTFSDDKYLTDTDNQLIDIIVKQLVDLVPCTACRYCIEECPMNLDIPKLISLYNETSYDSWIAMAFNIAALKSGELPSNCISCGACSRICPQNIDIPTILNKFSALIDEKGKK